MEEIIHCHECDRFYSHQDNLSFYMCTRLHITCELCFTVHSHRCPLCKSSCQIIQIEANAPPTMDILFKPVVSLLGNLQQVTQFQITNMQRVVRHLKAKVAKQKELLAQARIELAKARDYKWQIHQLQRENQVLRNHIFNKPSK